jgi:tetratricopeptide (TPR) repeat protein
MKINDLRTIIDMHFDKEEYGDALESCVALVTEHAHEVTFEDLFKKGLCHFKLDEDAEAIGCFNKALDMEPENVLALSNKGACLFNLGKTAEAFNIFGQTLKLNPNVFPAWYYIGMHYLKDYSETGNVKAMEKLVTCYRQVVSMAPDFGNFPMHDPQKNTDYRIDTFLLLHDEIKDLPIEDLIAL